MLTAFHHLAAVRGDGLESRLLAFMERRAAMIEAHPQIVEFNPASGFVQAGPCPRPQLPEFLPGNVIGLKPKAASARRSQQRSSATQP